jgi:ABC-type branched-subunit amino acid transport system substrate-binding protein
MHVARGSKDEEREARSEKHGLQRVLRFTLCLLLVILLSACTLLRITRPAIKVGLVGPFEGQYRYVGYDAIYAARLALREANASGGVGGYTVQLVAYDDRGTVAGARTAARNLALDSDVVAVVGHFRGETTAAAQVLYGEAGLPLVSAGTVEGEIGTERDLLCPLLDYLGHSSQNAAESDRQVQWMAGDPKAQAFTCKGGLTARVGTQLPPPPDVNTVLLTLDPVRAGEVLLALDQAGWNGTVGGGPTLGSPLFVQIADPVDVVFATPYRWPDFEGVDADFSTAYQSLGPHVPRPGPFALSTYQSVQTLLAAIEAAYRARETPTRQVLARYLTKPSLEKVYLYRWSDVGRLEFIGEETIPRSE